MSDKQIHPAGTLQRQGQAGPVTIAALCPQFPLRDGFGTHPLSGSKWAVLRKRHNLLEQFLLCPTRNTFLWSCTWMGPARGNSSHVPGSSTCWKECTSSQTLSHPVAGPSTKGKREDKCVLWKIEISLYFFPGTLRIPHMVKSLKCLSIFFYLSLWIWFFLRPSLSHPEAGFLWQATLWGHIWTYLGRPT